MSTRWPWAYGGTDAEQENTRRTTGSPALPAHELWFGNQTRVRAGEPARLIDWLEIARFSRWLEIVGHVAVDDYPAWTISDYNAPNEWVLKSQEDWVDAYFGTPLLSLCVGGCADDDTEITLTRKIPEAEGYGTAWCLTKRGEVLKIIGRAVADGDNWKYQMKRAAAMGAAPGAIADGEWISSSERIITGTAWDQILSNPPIIKSSGLFNPVLFYSGIGSPLSNGNITKSGTQYYIGFVSDPYLAFPVNGNRVITSFLHTSGTTYPLSIDGVSDVGLFLGGIELLTGTSTVQVDAITKAVDAGTGYTGRTMSMNLVDEYAHPAARSGITAEVVNSQRRRIECCSQLGAFKSGFNYTIYALPVPAPTTIYNPEAVGGRRYS